MNKFRGYEFLNTSMVLPAISCIASHFSLSALSDGERLSCDAKEEEVLTACIEWLFVQGVLKGSPADIEAGPAAKGLFQNIAAIEKVVAVYGELAELVEHLVGIRKYAPDGLSKRLARALSDPITAPYWIDALLPAALTFLHECPSGSNPAEAVGKALLRNADADLMRLLPETLSEEAYGPLLTALIERGLLEDTARAKVRLTDKGRTLLKLGGYAELILSYYPVFYRLPELSLGTLEYGLGKDVNRAPELNARASNGIIEVRVAPAILVLLETNPLVRRTLASHGGIAIDFGAGGGEMVQAFLKCPLVERGYGLDINPDAVDEAQKLAQKRGISKKNIKFLVGSIGDRAAFEAFKFGLLDGARPVCTINFILHDVDRKMARDFLHHYREVLTGSPLIITESFRVPLEAMLDHPNYQTPSFKFMHDISGQRLFYKEEFENLIKELGFQIIEEISHSSMFWKKENRKLTTIATYVLRSA